MTLITPQIGSFYKPSAPVSSGYSFNMTAGSYLDFIGYIGGFLGSIDAEPIEDYDLASTTLEAGAADSVSFYGDCLALVSGLSVYVDGVLQYTPSWEFDGTYTEGTNTPTVFPFVDGGTYFVELK